MAFISGGDMIQGFASGALGSLGSSAFGAIAGAEIAGSTLGTVAFGAVSGGVGAALSGGDFWQGASIGASIALLNHAGHRVLNGSGEGDPPGKKRQRGGWFKKHVKASVGIKWSVGKQIGLIGASEKSKLNNKFGAYFDAGSSIVMETETKAGQDKPFGTTYKIGEKVTSPSGDISIKNWGFSYDQSPTSITISGNFMGFGGSISWNSQGIKIGILVGAGASRPQ